jgi:hypothetical protein
VFIFALLNLGTIISLNLKLKAMWGESMSREEKSSSYKQKGKRPKIKETEPNFSEGNQTLFLSSLSKLT